MIEFEQKMAQLAAALSADGKELTGHVLGLELRNRFNLSVRSQLPETFAGLALKTVKARPGDNDPT